MEDKSAVEVAKEIASDNNNSRIKTLTTGVRVRLNPVSTALLDEVSSRIREPEIPIWHNPDKDRDEPNPMDPRYVRDVEDVHRKRGIAVMDALVMFGIELIDGLPADSGWLTKLRFMEKHGQLDLSGYDLNDPLELEFLYKRFVAVDNDVLTAIGELSAITQEAVEKAQDSFPSNKKR